MLFTLLLHSLIHTDITYYSSEEKNTQAQSYAVDAVINAAGLED